MRAVNQSPSARQRVCQFTLRLGGEEVEVRETVPARVVRAADLLPLFQRLTDTVVGAVARQAERRGQRISCRAGCGACCRQPVPVAEAEAIHLAELVGRLPIERGERVRRRFAAALDALERAGCLGDVRRLPRVSDEAERRRVGLGYFRLQIPCPFLEEESCSIYPHRPLACREYLVVSPASRCSDPGPQVERLAFPVRPSRLLYRFGDGLGKDNARWVPLVLALVWAGRGRGRAARRFFAPGLYESFVTQLAGQPRPGADTG